MSAICFGLSATAALFALIPSKKEAAMDVPKYSIYLAVVSGIFLALGMSWN